MKAEYITSCGILVASALLLVAVNRVPPLTEPSGPFYQIQPARYLPQDAVSGRSFCEETLTGVDCGCFAYRAALVLDASKRPLAGVTYENPWQLALEQASASCAIQG